MKKIKKTTHCESVKERRRQLIRRLKFYSTAASLGAFACSSTSQGAVTLYDIPDVTITNDLSGVSQFIEINPDGGAPEFSVVAPGAQNQIRISPAPLAGAVGDERGAHVGLVGAPIAAPSSPDAGEGNQVLSIFGNPGSVAPADPNPGYYVESVPAGSIISRSTMSPSFYADLAARGPYTAYNKVDTGKYIGLQWDFDGTGDVRYGWAQIDVTPISTAPNPPGFYSATLTAYAFEMTPNLAIRAGSTTSIPEPGALALLAAGGGGLALAARRRRKAC